MTKKTLKDLREKRGLTQEEVAKLTNMTKVYISLLENGKRGASDEVREKLAKLYRCDIVDIFLATRSTKS